MDLDKFKTKRNFTRRYFKCIFVIYLAIALATTPSIARAEPYIERSREIITTLNRIEVTHSQEESKEKETKWNDTIFREQYILAAALVAAAGIGKLVSSKKSSKGAQSPEDFETEEFNAQWGLGHINAQEAYARKFTGTGQTIAIFDNGFDVNHPEFAGKIVYRYNAADGSSDLPIADHGTHVAGIAAALKNDLGMHGVAYNANLALVMMFVPDFDLFIDAYANAAALDPPPAAYNNSWEWVDTSLQPISINTILDDPDFATSPYLALSNQIGGSPAQWEYFANVMSDAQEYGVFVFGVSNETTPDNDINVTGGLPLALPDLQGAWIAVVNVNQNNVLNPGSQGCASGADFCIAAPGTSIFSTLPGGEYGYMTGSSMATPHVSGAVALLAQVFALSPEEITNRLFMTANKAFDGYDENAHGQGVLNLATATQPLGGASALRLITGDAVSESGTRIGETWIVVGGAFGDSLLKAFSESPIAAFDRGNAPFRFELKEFIKTLQSRNCGIDVLRRLRPAKHNLTQPLYLPDSSISFGFHREPEAILSSLRPELDEPFAFSVGSFSTPYFGLLREGFTLFGNIPLSEQSRISINAITGEVIKDNLFGRAFNSAAHGAFGSLIYEIIEGLEVALETGWLAETGSVLGSVPRGAFATNSTAGTFFSGAHAQAALNDSWSLYGSYYRGRTNLKAKDSSIFTGFSELESQSVSLGLVGRNILMLNDQVGLLISQPLRIEKGRVNMDVPVFRDREGNVLKEQVLADLSPSGRELRLEAVYDFALSDATRIKSLVLYRLNPEHRSDIRDDSLLILRLDRSF